MTISGGTSVLLGAIDGNEPNAALDCDGTFTLSGGTVLAIGLSEMAEVPSSGQSYVTWTAEGTSTAVSTGSQGNQGGIGAPGNQGGGPGNQGGNQNGFISNGDVVTVYDSSGNILISVSAKWDYSGTSTVNYVFYSSSSVTTGKTYTLVLNTEEDPSPSPSEDPSPSPSEDPSPSPSEDPSPSESTTDNEPYISGYDDDTFRPDNSITRAEAAQILYNLLKTDVSLSYSKTFSDVSEGDWYYDAIMYLAEMSIIDGYSDDSFRPDENITRAEFAKLIVLYAGYEQAQGESSFTDVDESHWSAGYIKTAEEQGLIEGYSDGTFGVEYNITRAETVTMINRMLGRDADNIDFTNYTMPFTDVPTSHWAYNQIMAASITFS